MGGRQVWTALASDPRQWSPDLAGPSVPSAYPLPHHSSCTESQPFPGRPYHLVPSFSVAGRVYILSGGGMGSGALKCCQSCAPKTHACPVPSYFSLTCRDSGQVSPPFLALQSVGNRHADLQTDRRQRGTARSMGWGPFPESGPSSSYNFSPTSPASQPPLLLRPQALDQDAFQTILGLCLPPAQATRRIPTPLREVSYFLLGSECERELFSEFVYVSPLHCGGASPPPNPSNFRLKNGLKAQRRAVEEDTGPPTHIAPRRSPHSSRDPLLSPHLSPLLLDPSPISFHPCPGRQQWPPSH